MSLAIRTAAAVPPTAERERLPMLRRKPHEPASFVMVPMQDWADLVSLVRRQSLVLDRMEARQIALDPAPPAKPAAPVQRDAFAPGGSGDAAFVSALGRQMCSDAAISFHALMATRNKRPDIAKLRRALVHRCGNAGVPVTVICRCMGWDISWGYSMAARGAAEARADAAGAA